MKVTDPITPALFPSLADYGCGRHSYCSFCTRECLTAEMKLYLDYKYSTFNPYNPSVMKHAIINIVATCQAFNFSV